MYLVVAWVFGLTTLRYAPGSPDYYFQTTISDALVGASTFNCSDTDVLTYCDNSTFNLSVVSKYNDSCVGGSCRTLTCDYGDAAADDLLALCSDNGIAACFYGTIGYYQV